MNNKSKRILRQIIEKFYEEFIDDQELSDDMKKERLLDIGNKLKPPSNDQASPHDHQKHNVAVKSIMSTSNANRTTDAIQQPIQANDKGNVRSYHLKEFRMLSPLKRELKIRGEIGDTGQKDKLTMSA